MTRNGSTDRWKAPHWKTNIMEKERGGKNERETKFIKLQGWKGQFQLFGSLLLPRGKKSLARAPKLIYHGLLAESCQITLRTYNAHTQNREAHNEDLEIDRKLATSFIPRWRRQHVITARFAFNKESPALSVHFPSHVQKGTLLDRQTICICPRRDKRPETLQQHGWHFPAYLTNDN